MDAKIAPLGWNSWDCYGAAVDEETVREIAKMSSICEWNTDMYGVDPEKEGEREYYDSIFSLYASWGVDFIKCDDIARELPHEETELVLLSEALQNCGRDMILSLSPEPALLEMAELYKKTSNMWRITDDFWDNWESLYHMFERAEKWCIFRSPLMIGGEMTGFDDFTMSLITNEEILKMHGNARHSHQVWRREADGTEYILWVAASAEGGMYLAVFNLGDRDGSTEILLQDVEIYEQVSGRELWSGETVSDVERIPVELKSHGAKAYYIHC